MTTASASAWHWYRVSTGNQDADGQHAEKQVPEVEAHSAARGYVHAPEHTSTIQGGSAFKGSKKFDAEWARVLDAFKAGRVSVLVVWALNRLDRKLSATRLVQEVQGLGGTVEFVTQPALTRDSMGGRISFNVMEEIAHEESTQKALAKHRDNNQKRELGYVTGAIPWGFTPTGIKDHKVPVVTPTAARYMPGVYRYVIEGWTLGRIASWLESEGVPAPGRGVEDVADASWYPRTVGSLVKNTCWRGSIFNGRKFLRFEWSGADNANRAVYGDLCYIAVPPVVDAATWARANANLAARPSCTTRGAAPKALLASVIYCPLCGGRSPMYLSRDRYRCTGRGGVRTRVGCGNNVPVAVADALADAAMSKQTAHLTAPAPYADPTADERRRQELLDSIDRLDKSDLTAFMARVGEIQAECDALGTAPSVPPAVVELAETYAGRWAEQSEAERGGWLRSAGVRMYAAQSASVAVFAAELASRTDYTRSAAVHGLETADGVTLAAFFGVLG